MPPSLTALIITFNEAPNIARCLDRLHWVPRVVVLDSGSTDDTLAVAARYDNVEVVHRSFDSFGGQCNFGLGLVVSDWVLSLDADYLLDPLFEAEALRAMAGQAAGWRARFRYCIHGRPLSGTLYPPRTILYRKEAAHYEDEGHGHRVRIEGLVQDLNACIDHDDRKCLSRWMASQIKYSEAEAVFLLSAPAARLNRIDKLRSRAWIMPFLAPVYCLIVKGLWRDGLAGWHYTLQRWVAETLIALAVVELRIHKPAA